MDDLDPTTEREEDVGPPVPGGPPMVDLVALWRGVRRLFGGD